MMLWTNGALISARRNYQATAFSPVPEEPRQSFGHDLAGRVWMHDL
jgi:hypothetical protein